ncbi:MAG TPA: LytTR family DNA-binding domain-containing protein [Terracidiphilus sp.]|nr:LytTR family DNA-binding domain-containing protein [Terracidiphilus sp.]
MSLAGWKSLQNPGQGAPGDSRQTLPDVSPPRAKEKGPSWDNESIAGSSQVRGAAPEKYLKRMAVRAGDKIVLVSMNDVLWIQSHGNLVRLHLETASYEHRTTIKNAYTHLDPGRFVRVHRNAIVNLDYVTEFDLPRCGNAFVRLRNGKALPISKTARTTLRRELLLQSYGLTDMGDG